jgi:GT2 family glycosyltransferase
MTPDKTLELSIVIVNYNVSNFLEQCLNSVFAALKSIPAEVFVVDNNSVDGSQEMLQQKFPQVQLIANTVNVGFSKANNQAIEVSKGRYVLLLNPDTVVQEDTFESCLRYMDQHPEAGALGVRMLDGRGRFLPESKRGLPTPAVSFYKIFGLSKLFPKSKFFNRYSLGYLDELQNHEVDVLCGAFMFMRAEALQKVGLLDEAFFMYGEDIDLSYRIQLGGYKVFYLAETKIIHYKGESTKKGSLNYVFVFYNAMIIFAQKHFSKRYAKLFSITIHLAIYLRASLSLLKRIVSRSAAQAFDFMSNLLLLIWLADQWKVKQIDFPDWLVQWLVPGYLICWIFSAWILGLYDKGTPIKRIWKSTFFATLGILALYALLPKEWQFSRLFILLGAISFIGIFYCSRALFMLVRKGKIDFSQFPKKRFGIFAAPQEFERIKTLLEQTYPHIESIHHIELQINDTSSKLNSNHLDEMIEIHHLNELIFSAKDLSSRHIIEIMVSTSAAKLEYKIAQPDTSYLIGSNSIDTAGEYYTLHFDALEQATNKRIKRVFDLTLGTSIFLLSPILSLFFKNSLQFFKNIFGIIGSKYTFVGLNMEQQNRKYHKKSILRPYYWNTENQQETNLRYTKNYDVVTDFKSILKNYRLLDQQPS